MTRKDFQLIAETIRTMPTFEATAQADGPEIEVLRFSALCNRFAEELATTNPRFDKDRFIAACNGKGGR
jgi:hypothetical protein